MRLQTHTFLPGPTPNTVRSTNGNVLTVPVDWVLLPPGDAAFTRRVKAAGDHWVVAEKKGRKVFSRGVWASSATIERIRAELTADGGAYVPSLPPQSHRPRQSDRKGRYQQCNAGRKRDGCQDQANSSRAKGRGCRDRLDAPSDDCLRLDGDSEGEGEATRGPTNACPALPGVTGLLSSWGCSRW
jgi:hypothetical protein